VVSDLVRRSLPHLPGGAPPAGLPPSPDPSPRGPSPAGASALRRARRAAIDALAARELERQRAEDAALEAAARGAAGVGRAVRAGERARLRLAPAFAIPPRVGLALALAECAACELPIEPGGAVRYRGDLYHAGCAAELVRAAA